MVHWCIGQTDRQTDNLVERHTASHLLWVTHLRCAALLLANATVLCDCWRLRLRALTSSPWFGSGDGSGRVWVRARVGAGVGVRVRVRVRPRVGVRVSQVLLGSPGLRLLRTRSMRSAVTLGSDVLPIGDGGIVEDGVAEVRGGMII